MKNPNHILVLRLSALGDVAMTVPVLRVFSRTYPEVKLTFVSRKFFKPLLADIPNLTFLEADVYGKHKGVGLIKLAEEAKSLGIDAVADLHDVLRSKVITNYLKVCGIKTAKIDKGRTEKKALTRSSDKVIKQLKSTHQRYADVFSALGFPVDLSKHQFPKRKELTPRLQSLIGNHSKKLIGIAPFAAHDSKMYPLKMMREVIATLDKLGNYHMFLFGGGASEIEKLESLATEFSTTTNIAGQLTFEEELAFISNLDIMLSMDSGNGHLAAMLGIPVITLWGVTHPYAGFTPLNQPMKNQLTANLEQFPLVPTSVYGNKFPEGYENAIASIKPSEVVSKIQEIL